MTIYLVRHGKDDPTLRGGWSQAGLTAEGHQQAETLADYARANQHQLQIRRVFASDLPRATETAMPLAAALGLVVEQMPQFREANNGALAGMPNEIASERYPGLYWNVLDWDERYPGSGESPRMCYERIKDAWATFSEEATKAGENVCLVTHGGVINIIYTLVRGTSFSNKTPSEAVPHAKLIAFELRGSAWKEKTLLRGNAVL